MSIIVLRGGLQTSVQDAGGCGVGRYGVPERGALDSVSLRLANMLVGNAPDVAAIEMTLDGAHLLFERAARIAICGADFAPEATVASDAAASLDPDRVPDAPARDGRASEDVTTAAIPRWRPVEVGAGAVLRFGRARSGARTYLAIAGGVDVPVVLGGRGTHLRAGFGGFQGRPLRAGDRLSIGTVAIASIADATVRVARWSLGPALRTPIDDVQRVRCIASDVVGIDLPARFELTVASASDRMGVRFVESLGAHSLSMTSEPAMTGAMQVPPDGRPIVLLADHQTTGGYPVVAHVATVDLPRLGQARPGTRVVVERIGLEAAGRLLCERERDLRRLWVWIDLRRMR